MQLSASDYRWKTKFSSLAHAAMPNPQHPRGDLVIFNVQIYSEKLHWNVIHQVFLFRYKCIKMRWAEEDFCVCDDSMTWLPSELHLFLSNSETKPRGQAARTFCYVRPQCHIALNDLYGHQPLLLWISWWYLGKPHIILVLFKSRCCNYLHHNRTTSCSWVHLVTNRIAHRRSGN